MAKKSISETITACYTTYNEYNSGMKLNYKVYILFAFTAATHLTACVAPVKAPPPPSGALPMLTGHVHVYDGDSIFFGHVEVRLDAIDAPERDQACRNARGGFWPCGITARDALRAMIGGEVVRCASSGRDAYDRLLATCTAGGRDLGAAMVESGNAIAYRYFSARYARQESRARAQRLGIWQDAQFTAPYFCRHFQPGHTCYEYDYAAGTGRVATLPLIGKSRATDAPE